MKFSRIVMIIVVFAGGPALAGAEADWEGMSLWQDPEFQKRFLADYGTRAEVEPGVTIVEKEMLEKIIAVVGQPNGLERATVMLSRAIKPSNSAVFDFTLAGFYFQSGETELALKWYRRAIDKHPAFLRAHKNLGQALVKRGKYRQALPSLTRAIELGAVDGVTYGLLGFAFLMTERFASAESAYRQAVMLQPAVKDWKLGLARSLFKQRCYGEASTLCAEMLAKEPLNADFWLLQANAYLGLKQPMKAAANYEYLALMGEGTAASMNMLGDIYVNEGLVDMAGDAYTRALKLEAEGSPTRALRNADVLAARGGHKEAEQLAAEIRHTFGDRLADEDRKRLLKLAARMAASQGDAQAKHVALLEEIIALDPLDGEALILLGQHYSQAGNVEKACFLFERAEGIEAHAPMAFLRHAQALVRDQQYANAIPLLKRSQELRPRDDIAAYLEQVQRAARTLNN